MMETVEVTEHRSNPELLPVQIVSSEGGRVEVISKMAPNPGHMTPDMMTATQYINLHRLPEHMNKVIVTDPISGDLIAHHVDLTSASGGEFAPHAHYYDTEELLAHGLTAEEERRIAAEIVAVQLKQGGGTLVTAQDLLNAKTLTSLSTVSMDGQKAVYIQTVEDVDMQNLQQQENAERCIMKIYPQQQHEMQVLTRTQSQQPLPPLKKVLSSQSMMIRNKYNETPGGIMVELHNSQLLDNNSCIKSEHHLEDAATTQQVVMTTTSTPTPTTTTLAPPPHPPPLLAPPPHPPPLTTAHKSAPLAPPPLATNPHPPSLATTHNSASLATSPHPPSLAPPTDESEEEEDDGESARAASRKSLPHKKRFPRKLKATPTGGARVGAQKTYKCSKCGESFSTQQLLTAHRSVHTGAPIKQRAFNCELCQNKQFATQLKFFEHLKGHYEPARVGEGVTESGASNLEMPPIQDANTIIADAKNDHVTQQQQQQQQQQYVEEQPLTAPVKTELLTCLQCGRGFKRQKALAAHHAIAHAPPPPPLLATPPPQPPGPRPLHDNMAADEFSEPEDMMEGIRHVVNMPAVDSGDEEHHLDDKIRWRYQLKASSIYRSIPDMGEMDLQDMHTLQAAQPLAPAVEGGTEGGAPTKGDGGASSEKGGEKRPPLTCLECNRVFNHRNSLLYHLRSHSGVRPHQCDICGKGFISGSALKVHMRLHSGAKPYKCEHCNRQFRQWGDLKYHVTSLHSDQKQFQCEYCGKDFARKYSLNVHRRIHTGEKNYECEFCGKSFRASSYLKNHRRIHTGEKPHLCDLCGKPFRVRSDMKRHRRTHTKDQAGNEIIVQGGEEDVDDPRIAPHQAHIVEGEDHSPEIILPDQAPHTPLNLNMRQGGTDGEGGELVYTTAAGSRTTHSVDSRDGTLYVWIPAPPHSILSDE